MQKAIVMNSTVQRGDKEPQMTQARLGFDKVVPSAQTSKLSLGRTVSLGQYQFARLGVTVEAQSFEVAQLIAQEVLDREIACLAKESRERVSLDHLSEQAISIGIEYGLTLKIKQFESGKVDVGLTRQVNEESLEEVIRSIQQITSERLNEEAKKIGLLASAREYTSLRTAG